MYHHNLSYFIEMMSLPPYKQQYILIPTNKHVKLNLQQIQNQGYGKIMTFTNFTDMI